MKKILVSLMLMFSCTVFGQDLVTGNLITNTWQGTTPGSYNGLSGGYMPGYVSGDSAIVFGYNQGTASQSIGVASALNAAGAGVQVKGYTYSWYYYNNDMNRGTLTGNISLTGSAGNTLETYNYTMPQTGIGNWIPQSGSQLFNNPYQINQVSNLNVSFTGKDDRWWAGYYGPAIKSINVKLMYGVDPCATNPAYSTTCAGFSSIIDSNNLVPNPNGYATDGNSINNSYAINQALSSAGSGIAVHGFKWGYVANANGPYCAFWLLVCFDERNPSVTTNVSITDSAGANLYSMSRTYTNSYNTTSYSYLFPSSRNVTTLGNFNFTATTNDQAYVGSMWSKAIYTPDPCVQDPMSSPTCKGYYDALTKYLASLQPPTVATTTTSSTGTSPTSSTTTTTTTDPTPVVTVSTTSSVGTVSATPQVVASPTSTSTTSSTTSSTTTSSTQTTKESSGSSSNTSLALSIISKNSERDTANAAVAASAVSQAQQAAAQAQQEAQTVAASAVANSTSSSATLMGSQQFTGSGIKVNGDTSFSLQSSTVSISSFANNTQSVTSSMQQVSGLGLANTLTQIEQNQAQQISMLSSSIQTSNESYSLVSPSALTDKSNPLNNAMEQKQIFPQSNISMSTGPVVNKNAQDNEAAGGVSLNRMALAPTGYGDYLNFTLRDASFYAPKEVYRNQRNVDNARALRQMTNDSRHRELVELQYSR